MKNNILIVDNDALVRGLLTTILEKAGYDCQTASDVAEAKQLLTESPFALLLTELNLPDELGGALIRHCKQWYPEMAVVIASAIDDPKQINELLDLGIYGYIVKPFTTNLALITVGNSLRRHRLEIEAQLHTRMLEREVAIRTASLNEQVHFLQNLLDAIPAPIYYKNTDYIYLGCNRACEEIFEQSRDKIIGKTAFEVHPHELAVEYHEKDMEIYQTGGVQLYQQEKIFADGSYRTGIIHKATFNNSAGALAGLIAIGFDITELKKSEHSLHQSKEKLRSIMDNLHIGVVMIDSQLGVLQLNKQMCTWFPLSLPETSNLKDFFRDQQQEYAFTDFSTEDLFSHGKAQETSAKLSTTDGDRIFRIVVNPVFDDSGEITAAVGLFEDITEKLLLERELYQTQKLEAIGQLAAGIAHEINTPVQYIGDNMRFLNDSFQEISKIWALNKQLLHALQQGEPTDELVLRMEQAICNHDLPFLLDEIPHTIEQSLDGINRVGAIVRAMREFSHPGSEEKVLVDINHALDNTLTVSRNEWKYLADVNTDFDPDLPMPRCLPGEINQVFLNLIVNAAHAIAEVISRGTAKRGTISVSTRTDDGWIEIRIGDSGGGIPEAIQDRIFEPFFTTKKVGVGTGQGLAIARSVVLDKHQGSLRFTTEAGQGTTFIIRLPLR